MALGDVPDEVLDVVVGRPRDELLRRPDLDDPAGPHDHHVIAELQGLGEIVGDEDHRLAELAVEADHLVLHIAPDQRVEGAEGFVEEHHLGVAGEGASEADPLLLATRELVGIAVCHPIQADETDHLTRPLHPSLLGLTPELEAEGDVVEHPPMRQQAEVLEDHREPAPTQLPQALRAGLADVLAVEVDLAGRRFDQAGETADQRRLAAAGQAHHHEDLAGLDIEGDVADGSRAPVLLAELLVRQVGGRRADDLVLGRAEDLPQAADADRRAAGGRRVGRAAGGRGTGRRRARRCRRPDRGVGHRWTRGRCHDITLRHSSRRGSPILVPQPPNQPDGPGSVFW